MSQNQSSDRIVHVRKKFEQDISALLHPSNREGTKFFNYLESTAKKLRLSGLDAREVISEAYVRGIVTINDKGQEIENPKAWLRKVCTFIMYDMVKEEKKNRLLKEKNQYSSEASNSLLTIVDSEQHQVVKKALAKLSDNDRQILRLRFDENLSYKEIQEQLCISGEAVKVPALRKRESRALARLKARFQEESQ